jgi:predicted metal-binding protein
MSLMSLTLVFPVRVVVVVIIMIMIMIMIIIKCVYCASPYGIISTTPPHINNMEFNK